MILTLFFKIFGALVVICCGWSLGNSAAGKLRCQRVFWEDLITLCELLENNALYLRRPLPDFFVQEITSYNFSVLSFPPGADKNFSVWRKTAWIQIVRQSDLEHASLDRVRSFWDSLGTGGAEEEAERIRYYHASFVQARTDAKNKEDGSVRVYRSLGICGGMVAALLLL